MRLLLCLCGAVVALAAQAAPEAHYVGTLSGNASVLTSRDGAAATAVFRGPRQAVADSAGTVYVADAYNHTVRKISQGVVSTLAGQAGVKGYADGAASSALFNEPSGVLIATDGSVLVLDTNNGRIRRISASGQVTTLVGGGGGSGRYADGTGAAAGFNEPRGFAQDSAGNLYVADYNNHVVRKVTPAGVVTTLAGTAGQMGSTDGTGSAARFSSPQAVAVDSAGNLFVSDTGLTKGIRKISPAGVVTTLVSSAGSNAAARLGEVRGLVALADGSVLAANAQGHEVVRVSASGAVSSFAGQEGRPGTADGTGTGAGFYTPMGLSQTASGVLLLADSSNHLVRQISLAGAVTTLAGQVGYSASVEGERAQVRLDDPYAVAQDASGNVYVVDPTDHALRKITPDGRSSVLAGKPGTFGFADGTGTAARFFTPYGVAVTAEGVVYVADTGNHAVRRVTADGVVTTLAGSGQSGARDGNGTAAQFNSPYGVAVDSAGTVYVADFNSHTVRKITPAGVVTTLAGSAGNRGFTDGSGSAARFTSPIDLTVDSAGAVYVVDRTNHAIRKISAAGAVTTLAGTGSAGFANGVGRAAAFHFPSGIAVDSAGNVLVADTDNQMIRHITPDGVVSTLAGGTLGLAAGVGTAARFNNPKDVSVNTSGRLVVADRNNHLLRSGAPLNSGTTTVDCLLDWAEANYASLLTPAALSQTAAPYTFRAYTGGIYLGASSADQQVYLLSAGRLSALGALSGFLGAAGCVAR